MKAAVLFSGGKDSAYSAWWAQTQGWTVSALVSVVSENKDSYMYHVPNIKLAKLLAEAIELPYVEVRTKGEKEKELDDLKQALAKLKKEKGIACVIAGALASEYQKNRVEYICEEIGLKSFAPIWHKDQEKMLREQSENFELVFAGVYAHGFDEKWLGRRIDSKAITDLIALNKKYGVSIGGEGGEYESLTLNGPNFKRRVVIEEAETKWDGVRGEYLVVKARLE